MKIGDHEIEVVATNDLPEGILAMLVSPPVVEYTIVLEPHSDRVIEVKERWFPERAVMFLKGEPDVMTKNEQKILEVLRDELQKELRVDPCVYPDGRWMTPTNIGKANGRSYAHASGWACRYLKHLCDRGLAKRRDPGEYAITEAGLAALETE